MYKNIEMMIASSTLFARMSSTQKFNLPARYEGQGKTVWEEYVQLIIDYNPLDLGRGYPNFAPPQYITDALIQATNENMMLHQYARGRGHPRLINALGKLYSELIGRSINPHNEILITAGAYEALYVAIMGHIDVGDEVIIIEPFFDSYEPVVRTAGGVPRFIPLRFKPSSSALSSNAWVLDNEELENAFNSKTKAIILNTPSNPLGKVFTENELNVIASLCQKWDVLCISDEVYEWMVYTPQKHIRIASLPGMWERTITVGSAGKTFAVTGWRIGWAYGSANMLHNLQIVHQNSIYSCSTVLQEALAISFETELGRLDQDDCFFKSLARQLEQKRNYMAEFLSEAGMKPIMPNGGFFMIADWSALESQIDLSAEKDKYKDYRFTKWLTKVIGIQAIPPTAFYSEPHKPLAENLVRFTFIKDDDMLMKAAKILKNWKQSK